MRKKNQNIKRSHKKILVFGDLMLDNYINGSVIKYCDDPYIPVLKVNNTQVYMGGAANVVNNLNALGCNVSVCGIVGNDNNGDVLKGKLSEITNTRGVFYVSSGTIIKNIISSEKNQILRYDIEDKIIIDSILESKLKEYLNYEIDTKLSAVIISDYCKGTCSDEICKFILKKCSSLNIPVLVDSKCNNWEKYKGAYLVKPNIKDFGRAYQYIKDEEHLIDIVKDKLVKKIGISKVILTRSEDGVVYLDSKSRKNIPAYSENIIDPTGCGDTLLAVIAMYITSTVPFFEIIKIACVAAWLVGNKKNTATVTYEELLYEIKGSRNMYSIHI